MEAENYSETSVPIIRNQTKEDLKFYNSYSEARRKYELIITICVSDAFLYILSSGKL